MNDHDINELNKKIMSYVTKCYLDAFKSEGREYDPHLWSFEYILIKDKDNILHMNMFNWCKFRRVQGKVFYRLQRNMEKKFGIIVGNTADLRFSAYVGKAFTIDPNYTEAVFRYRDEPIMISLSIFDKESDELFQSDKPPRYVNLICHYNNITVEEYYDKSIKHNDLPKVNTVNDWEEYQKLFEETMGYQIGRGYEYFTSNGIERI